MVIVDTGVWIDFIDNKERKEVEILAKLLKDKQKVGLNSIIMMELLQGCKNKKEVAKFKAILNDFYCYLIYHDTIIQASEIYRACKKGLNNDDLTGQTINPLDCIIASNCIEYDLELLHRDVHFNFIEKITGQLKVYKG
jgi:predicted nucleic acid-binding protein